MKKNPTFGEFIRLTRKKKLKLPLVGLSKQIGISPAQLQRIEENRIRIYPDEKFLQKLSKALSLEYETLVDLLHHYKIRKPDTKSGAKKTPLIPWEFLSNIKNISPESIANGYIPSQPDNNKQTVAVKCQTAKWQPFITKNDIIIILINIDHKENDLLVSAVSESDYELLRVVKSGEKTLYFPAFPTFQQTNPISKNDNHNIIGVVDHIVRKYRNQ
ncbi:MAG: helix-turn-helix transcriptional regulator [bacterium]|nr:helix-turn-helix transcriptional regulator [bacterium]